MHQIDTTRSRRRKPVAATLLVLLLACLGLAACGGSSSSTTTTTGATNAASTTGGAGRSGRFAALRECLQKNGVTLPARPAGASPRGGPSGPGGPGGGGAGFFRNRSGTLPSGVSRAKMQAALKKCGGQRFGIARFTSPAYRKAVASFAACMRQNGVNLPTPNTSGKGPVFDTSGVNTAGTTFQTADRKCRSILAGAFPRRPGVGGGPPGAGAPPPPEDGGAG